MSRSISSENETAFCARPMLVKPVSECVPGWPLEWVSSRGRYDGKVGSLVLVHFSSTFVARDRGRKSMLLTVKDRRRRAWSAALIIDDLSLASGLESVLARMIRSRVSEIGAALVRFETPPKTPHSEAPATSPPRVVTLKRPKRAAAEPPAPAAVVARSRG